jgi:hypothetical protein
MKRKIVIIVTIELILILGLFSYPVLAGLTAEIVWEKTFGGSGGDRAWFVEQTQDGGYIMVGGTEASRPYEKDIWLIKTGSLGNKQWDKIFSSPYNDRGKSVHQTQDGGYIIASMSEEIIWDEHAFRMGERYVWLIKTDASGNKEWDKNFSGLLSFLGDPMQETQDGGYIITGHINSQDDSRTDIWLIKTDASGNKEWENTFGGRSRDYGNSIQESQDGGYIIVGETSSFGSGHEDIWLIKTDSMGNEQWTTTFGGSYDDYGYSVQQTQDGGYIITGETESSTGGGGLGDVWLIKTDLYGNKEWDRTFGGSDDDRGHSVQQLKNGGYIIVGATHSYGAGQADIWLIKTDSLGNKEWDRTFGGSGIDNGWSVLETPEGGYTIAGDTDIYSAGKADVWLLEVQEVEKPEEFPTWIWIIVGIVALCIILIISSLVRRAINTKSG